MNDDKLIGARIEHLRDLKGMSQLELSKRIGIDKSVMNRIESGDRPTRGNELKDIAKEFGVSVDYLLGVENIKPVSVNDFVKIPVIGTIKAGPDSIAYEDIDGYSSFGIEDVSKDKEYFVLKVKGDSMIGDGIFEGDLALIEKDAEYIKNKIYAVIINGYEGTLKHVTKTENAIVLTSSNPNYPPKIIKGHELEQVIIVGALINTKREFR